MHIALIELYVAHFLGQGGPAKMVEFPKVIDLERI